VRDGACVYEYVIKEENMKEFLLDEDGMGTIELVLILVVLIGLVIIFKGQIRGLLNTIFGEIESQTEEVF